MLALALTTSRRSSVVKDAASGKFGVPDQAVKRELPGACLGLPARTAHTEAASSSGPSFLMLFIRLVGRAAGESTGRACPRGGGSLQPGFASSNSSFVASTAQQYYPP